MVITWYWLQEFVLRSPYAYHGLFTGDALGQTHHASRESMDVTRGAHSKFPP